VQARVAIAAGSSISTDEWPLVVEATDTEVTFHMGTQDADTAPENDSSEQHEVLGVTGTTTSQVVVPVRASTVASHNGPCIINGSMKIS
jgi:hypothetical protein